MKQKINTLVVGAYPRELSPFCELGRHHFLVKNQVAYLAAGVGPVAAAFGLTHFLEDHQPKLIISVGTAGFVNQSLKIADVVRVGSVHVQSGSDHCYTAQPIKRLNLQHKKFAAKPYSTALSDFKLVDCFAPQEITASLELKEILAQKGHDVEHLETYAYVFVAKKFRIPILSFLAMTNQVGPGAHAQWAKNEKRALGAYGKTVKSFLKLQNEK